MSITDILFNLKDYSDSTSCFGKKVKLINKKLTTDPARNINEVLSLADVKPWEASDHNLILKNIRIIGRLGSNYLMAIDSYFADGTNYPLIELFLTPVSNVTFGGVISLLYRLCATLRRAVIL